MKDPRAEKVRDFRRRGNHPRCSRKICGVCSPVPYRGVVRKERREQREALRLQARRLNKKLPSGAHRVEGVHWEGAVGIRTEAAGADIGVEFSTSVMDGFGAVAGCDSSEVDPLMGRLRPMEESRL